MDAEELRTLVVEGRKKRGLTQDELAERAGVSLGTVQNIEGAKTKTQRDKREKVLGALGLSDTDEPQPPEGVERTWPADVSVFLDVLGTYLLRFDEPTRLQVIHDVTRQIFTNGPRH